MKLSRYSLIDGDICNWTNLGDIWEEYRKILDKNVSKITENELSLNLAGYGKEDVKITHKGNYVYVSSDVKDKEFEYEYYIGNYDKVKAKMKHGLLTLKFENDVRSNEIEIE